MRIVKDNGYYYLQHSVRQGDKIVTKKKYLGKEVPQNIEDVKDEFYRELNKEMFNKLDKIKQNFALEWNKIPVSARDKELEEIAIAFTYNTNAIEGSTITMFETREILVGNIAPLKSIDEIEETKRHGKVFLEALKNKEEITNELILKWHKNIFVESKEDIAGVFRDYHVRVGNYLAPNPDEVVPLMNNLVEFMKNSKFHPIEFAARAHYIFEMIHPFGDGNGRVGRLLMNYILWHSGYPMLVIEYKNRRAYYNALEKEEQDFVNYFLKLYLREHKKRYLGREL